MPHILLNELSVSFGAEHPACSRTFGMEISLSVGCFWANTKWIRIIDVGKSKNFILILSLGLSCL